MRIIAAAPGKGSSSSDLSTKLSKVYTNWDMTMLLHIKKYTQREYSLLMTLITKTLDDFLFFLDTK